MKTDFLIVGAGLSGAVVAQQLSAAGKSCFIVERRDHVAGNCYDYHHDGVLVHKYGPHYFRTKSFQIFEYLSRFTQWIPAQYRVLSHVDGVNYRFPINLNTFEQIIGEPSNSAAMTDWLDKQKVHYENGPQNSEELILSQVGWRLYGMFFEGYTRKQWSRSAKELSPSVCGRIPIRTNRDDRYFNDSYQFMPAAGYTAMVERIVGNVPVLLGTDWRNTGVQASHIIFTGPIDAYYDHRFGALPYRSLRFQLRTLEDEYAQPAVQINYPSLDVEHTRTVEVKHVTRQKIDRTVVSYEYPARFTGANEPYYPVPTNESAALYRQYRDLAAEDKSVTFLGRLGGYSYINMDACVGLALQCAKKLLR